MTGTGQSRECQRGQPARNVTHIVTGQALLLVECTSDMLPLH